MVRSSRPKKAGITWAGGSTRVSPPMPIIAEPKPERPRTTNAARAASPIQASVGGSNPSVIVGGPEGTEWGGPPSIAPPTGSPRGTAPAPASDC